MPATRRRRFPSHWIFLTSKMGENGNDGKAVLTREIPSAAPGRAGRRAWRARSSSGRWRPFSCRWNRPRSLLTAGVPRVLRKYFVQIFFGVAVLQLQQDLGERQAVFGVVAVEFELGQQRLGLAQVAGLEQVAGFQQLRFRGLGLVVQSPGRCSGRGVRAAVQLQAGPGGQQRVSNNCRGARRLRAGSGRAAFCAWRALQVQFGQQDLEFRDGGVFQALVEIFLGGREIVAQGVFLAQAQVGRRDTPGPCAAPCSGCRWPGSSSCRRWPG